MKRASIAPAAVTAASSSSSVRLKIKPEQYQISHMDFSRAQLWMPTSSFLLAHGARRSVPCASPSTPGIQRFLLIIIIGCCFVAAVSLPRCKLPEAETPIDVMKWHSLGAGPYHFPCVPAFPCTCNAKQHAHDVLVRQRASRWLYSVSTHGNVCA